MEDAQRTRQPAVVDFWDQSALSPIRLVTRPDTPRCIVVDFILASQVLTDPCRRYASYRWAFVMGNSRLVTLEPSVFRRSDSSKYPATAYPLFKAKAARSAQTLFSDIENQSRTYIGLTQSVALLVPNSSQGPVRDRVALPPLRPVPDRAAARCSKPAADRRPR